MPSCVINSVQQDINVRIPIQHNCLEVDSKPSYLRLSAWINGYGEEKIESSVCRYLKSSNDFESGYSHVGGPSECPLIFKNYTRDVNLRDCEISSMPFCCGCLKKCDFCKKNKNKMRHDGAYELKPHDSRYRGGVTNGVHKHVEPTAVLKPSSTNIPVVVECLSSPLQLSSPNQEYMIGHEENGVPYKPPKDMSLIQTQIERIYGPTTASTGGCKQYTKKMLPPTNTGSIKTPLALDKQNKSLIPAVFKLLRPEFRQLLRESCCCIGNGSATACVEQRRVNAGENETQEVSSNQLKCLVEPQSTKSSQQTLGKGSVNDDSNREYSMGVIDVSNLVDNQACLTSHKIPLDKDNSAEVDAKDHDEFTTVNCVPVEAAKVMTSSRPATVKEDEGSLVVIPNGGLQSNGNNRHLCLEESRSNGTENDIIGNGLHFIKLMDNEIIKINEKISDFDGELISPDHSNEINAMIFTAVGKAKLLMSKKFVQFRQLCDTNMDETITDRFAPTNADICGFWEMMYLQVHHINAAFTELEEIRSNDWKLIVRVEKGSTPTYNKDVVVNGKSPMKKVVPRKSTSPATKGGTPRGSSSLRLKIAAERKRLLDQKRAHDADGEEPVSDQIQFYSSPLPICTKQS